MLVVVFINSVEQCCSSLYLIGMAHDIDDGGGENDKLSLSFLFLFLLLLLLSVFVFFHHQMMGILVDNNCGCRVLKPFFAETLS